MSVPTSPPLASPATPRGPSGALPEPPLPDPERALDRAAIRRFNRFATAHAGALTDAYNGSPFPLPEARVLWELRHGPAPATAAAIARRLALDPAYLSRILARFRARALVQALPDPQDRRARALALTEAGNAAMDRLEAVSDADADRTLDALPPPARARLRAALAEAEALLAPGGSPLPAPVLRDLRPGDMGHVISRHGAIYAAEYGWGLAFESAVARIAADFLDARALDPVRNRAWIADRAGETLGAVFLVPGPADAQGRPTGKLRMLYLDPAARGLGLGRRLVREVIAAARAQGLARLDLWTHSCLAAARGIYASEGFVLVAEEQGPGFGAGPTIEETWSLDLSGDLTAGGAPANMPSPA